MPTFNDLPFVNNPELTITMVGAYSQNLASSASSTAIATIFNNTVTNNTEYLIKNSTSRLTVAQDFKALIVISMAHGNNLNGTMNNGTAKVNGTNIITCSGASATGYAVRDLVTGDTITGTFQKTDTNQHATFKIMIFNINLE